MPTIHSHLQQLASLAHSSGGWAYSADRQPHLEPTCLALLALALDAESFQKPIEKGWQFVGSCASADGSYRLRQGREEAIWPTALVLFAQATLGAARERVDATARRLLALRGRSLANQEVEEVHDINLRLIGWPWAEGNFSWAEPTAWACLALQRAGHGNHPRVEEGLRLLLDRAADTGGINYGNRRILGRATDPIPGPTALMLLALQRHANHPRIAAAVQYLRREALASDDLEHLCWAKLALSAYSTQPGISETITTLAEHIWNAQRFAGDDSLAGSQSYPRSAHGPRNRLKQPIPASP